MRKKRPLSPDDGEGEALINLTPLIDVVFVVLITFILIAPMLEIDSIDLATTGGLQKQEVQPGTIAISVKADNSIWFAGTKMSLTQLEQRLKLEKKMKPGVIPQVIHDKQATFGTYQLVKNTLESAGFEQMDIVLKPGS